MVKESKTTRREERFKRAVWKFVTGLDEPPESKLEKPIEDWLPPTRQEDSAIRHVRWDDLYLDVRPYPFVQDGVLVQIKDKRGVVVRLTFKKANAEEKKLILQIISALVSEKFACYYDYLFENFDSLFGEKHEFKIEKLEKPIDWTFYLLVSVTDEYVRYEPRDVKLSKLYVCKECGKKWQTKWQARMCQTNLHMPFFMKRYWYSKQSGWDRTWDYKIIKFPCVEDPHPQSLS